MLLRPARRASFLSACSRFASAIGFGLNAKLLQAFDRLEQRATHLH